MANDDELFRRLCRSRDYIADRIDRPVPLAEAARTAHLSAYHYHRLFARTFSETPHTFATRLRIDRAKRMLVQDQLTVTEICFALGYESLGTFSARFHSLVGQTPSQYRRTMRRIFPVPEIAVYRFVPACFLGAWGAREF